MKTVVLTGISSGIGEATARTLVGAGFRVIGLHRGAATPLFAEECGEGEYIVLKCDVRDGEQIHSLYAQVSEILGDDALYGLVNNAGISLFGPMIYQDPAEISEQLNVNFLGPIRLIQTLAPLLGWTDGRTGAPSRIVNVTSVSGRIVFPFMGAYSASKFALEAASDALRRELADFGIKTIVVEPGAIQTPLWRKTTEKPMPEYDQTCLASRLSRFVELFAARGAQEALPAACAADVILKALVTPRPRPRYSIMSHPIRDFLIPSLLPDAVVDFMLARQLR